MNDAKRELLMSYIKSNVAPILVDFIDGNNIPNSVVLPANLEISELNGHYENIEFVSPEWLNKLKSWVDILSAQLFFIYLHYGRINFAWA